MKQVGYPVKWALPAETKGRVYDPPAVTAVHSLYLQTISYTWTLLLWVNRDHFVSPNRGEAPHLYTYHDKNKLPNARSRPYSIYLVGGASRLEITATNSPFIRTLHAIYLMLSPMDLPTITYAIASTLRRTQHKSRVLSIPSLKGPNLTKRGSTVTTYLVRIVITQSSLVTNLASVVLPGPMRLKAQCSGCTVSELLLP